MFVIDIKLWRLQIDHGMSAFRGMSALYSNRRLWSIIVRTWTILLMIVLWLYFKFHSCTVNTFALRSFVSNRLFYNLLVQIYVVSSKDQKKIWIDNLKNVKCVVPQISKIVMVKRHYVLVANSFTSDPLKGWGRKFYITCIISTQAKHCFSDEKCINIILKFYRSNSFSYPCNCDGRCKNGVNCSCSEGSRNHCKHCRYVKCKSYVWIIFI